MIVSAGDSFLLQKYPSGGGIPQCARGPACFRPAAVPTRFLLLAPRRSRLQVRSLSRYVQAIYLMPLTVSTRQLAAITAVLEDQEDAMLLSYATERFPAILVPGSAECNTEWIKSVRMKAKRYGIKRGRNLAVFIDLTIMYGPGFSEAEWAADTLRSKSCSEAEKINILKAKLEAQGITI